MPDSKPLAADAVTHLPLIMRSDPSRTVVRPFSPGDPTAFVVPGKTRSQRIVDRVLALSGEEVALERRQITHSLDERHRDVDEMLLRRFNDLPGLTIDKAAIPRDQALLIGAYFCEEYSFEAAALFNPSMVVAPDQGEAPEGVTRFVISLRAIGEGHVSSVTFRTGMVAADGAITVDKPSPTAISPIIEKTHDDGRDGISVDVAESRDLSEVTLFPMTASQSRGIEDVRLVHFTEDDGSTRYYGTYTAFNGVDARCELLETTDFKSFDLWPLKGDAAAAKGLALFPRRIGGQFVMLGRQDSENIWLLRSDDLGVWNGGERLLRPRYPWEFIQIGNCGSPVEIDEGWLMLTHGVGTVRNYCVGATLLDRDDPSKVLARTPTPLLEPNPDERDGYVPNVVYSCGSIALGRRLILPYGVADGFAKIAVVELDKLLAAME